MFPTASTFRSQLQRHQGKKLRLAVRFTDDTIRYDTIEEINVDSKAEYRLKWSQCTIQLVLLIQLKNIITHQDATTNLIFFSKLQNSNKRKSENQRKWKSEKKLSRPSS